MTDKQNQPKPSSKHQLLQEQLAELKLAQIAEVYQQVLDDAARKNRSAFDVLSALVGAEITARHERALARRIRDPVWLSGVPLTAIDAAKAFAFAASFFSGGDVRLRRKPPAWADCRANPQSVRGRVASRQALIGSPVRPSGIGGPGESVGGLK